MLTIRIRPLRPNDEAALADADLPFTVEQLLAGAGDNLSVCLVLDDGGRIVGVAHLSAVTTPEGVDPTSGIIDRLAIDPGYEEHGAKLTNRLAVTAQVRGFSQVFSRILPAAGLSWRDAGWEVAPAGAVFGWTEADESTKLIRTLAADDVRDDGKVLAFWVSDGTVLYTWAFTYDHRTPRKRADHALRRFRDLIDNPLADVPGTIDSTTYRVI